MSKIEDYYDENNLILHQGYLWALDDLEDCLDDIADELVSEYERDYETVEFIIDAIKGSMDFKRQYIQSMNGEANGEGREGDI